MNDAARYAWREGIAPLLPTRGLEALRRALETSDPRVIQGHTTNPPTLHANLCQPIRGGCPISYAGWRDGLTTVGQVETWFAEVLFECGRRLNDPTAARHFLAFWDDTPREEARWELWAEVVRALSTRQPAPVA